MFNFAPKFDVNWKRNSCAADSLKNMTSNHGHTATNCRGEVDYSGNKEVVETFWDLANMTRMF